MVVDETMLHGFSSWSWINWATDMWVRFSYTLKWPTWQKISDWVSEWVCEWVSYFFPSTAMTYWAGSLMCSLAIIFFMLNSFCFLSTTVWALSPFSCRVKRQASRIATTTFTLTSNYLINHPNVFSYLHSDKSRRTPLNCKTMSVVVKDLKSLPGPKPSKTHTSSSYH